MQNLAGSTFVFIGRSGCGKGTQVALLEDFLHKEGYQVLRITTGDLGRELAQKKTLIGAWVQRIFEEGKLFPSWLALTLWLRELENALMDTRQVLLIDGAPRRLFEAQTLDELMTAVDRPAPIPVYLDISEDEARRRLASRSRDDDKKAYTVDMRLAWFTTDVMPVLDYYKERLMTISGEGTIDEVHQRLLQRI